MKPINPDPRTPFETPDPLLSSSLILNGTRDMLGGPNPSTSYTFFLSFHDHSNDAAGADHLLTGGRIWVRIRIRPPLDGREV